MSFESLRSALTSRPLRCSHEVQLQEDLFPLLLKLSEGSAMREYALGPKDRPDFYLPYSRFVVEVKLARSGGGVSSVSKQLERYARHECVESIALVTTSYTLEHSLPREFLGKKFQVINVGGAF